MNKLILGLFATVIFSHSHCIQVSTPPPQFYHDQATKLLNKFDFSNAPLREASAFFLAQRIHQIGKAITVNENRIQICNDRLFALEVQYLNTDLIQSMLRRYKSKKTDNGAFMLYFAQLVELNVLCALRDTIGFYFGNNLEEFEKNLNLKQITIEEFNTKIKALYSDEELSILSVLESRKFAAVTFNLLKQQFNIVK